MINLKEAFGLRLKNLRKSRKLTQEALSEILGVNTRQLNRIEAGENFPSAETLAKISCALDVELSYLFDFEWNREVTLLTAATDDVPVIRLEEKNKIIDFAAQKDKTLNALDKSSKISSGSAESIMLSVAAKLNKPITVEFCNDKKRKCIKTYYPNGESEVKISEKKIEMETIQNFVKTKMVEYQSDITKLEFIRLAAAAIENDNELKDLITFIKGMEFNGRLRRN